MSRRQSARVTVIDGLPSCGSCRSYLTLLHGVTRTYVGSVGRDDGYEVGHLSRRGRFVKDYSCLLPDHGDTYTDSCTACLRTLRG